MAIRIRYEKNGQLVVVDKNFSLAEAERMADFIKKFQPDAKNVKIIAPRKYLNLRERRLLGVSKRRMNTNALRSLRHKRIIEYIRHGPDLRYFKRELYDLIKPDVVFRTFKEDINFLLAHKIIPYFVFKDAPFDIIDKRRSYILDKMIPGKIYTSGNLYRSLEFGFDYKTFYRDIKELVHQGRIKSNIKHGGGLGQTTFLKKVI